MSVLHLVFTPGFKQAQLKVDNFKFSTMALFVTYADFESILEPLGRKVKHTTFSYQRKVCAAAAILCSSLEQCNQMTVLKVGFNALGEFLDVLIEWKTAIVEELRTNRPIKRMNVQQQKEYENAIECYICRHAFIKDDSIRPKVRYHDNTGFF